ncbi:hypothetical protein WR25_11535 [Diploscapter pachys]|uniref:Uncharacterized protein n=1 Tax=Diploscapter pachys TaxID=2018661 RepID=A0A2A2KA76_9BILA|nr:hypothetical protein WR25_11535 [Diploscapter pachys]
MKSDPNRMAGTAISSISILLLEARLQRGEFGIHLVALAQLGDFLFQRLRHAQAQRFRAALGIVDAAFQDVEAAERLVSLGAGVHLAEAVAVVGAFQPRLDVGLLGARLGLRGPSTAPVPPFPASSPAAGRAC